MDDEEWLAIAAVLLGAILGCVLGACLMIIFGGAYVWRA
jgi:hypothetical protein